jgi:hypothetical protein
MENDRRMKEPSPEAESSFSLQLNADQKTTLTIWLNAELRNRTLRQKYAETLHGMYVQLTGSNHDVWDSLGGEYQP